MNDVRTMGDFRDYTGKRVIPSIGQGVARIAGTPPMSAGMIEPRVRNTQPVIPTNRTRVPQPITRTRGPQPLTAPITPGPSARVKETQPVAIGAPIGRMRGPMPIERKKKAPMIRATAVRRGY